MLSRFPYVSRRSLTTMLLLLLLLPARFALLSVHQAKINDIERGASLWAAEQSAVIAKGLAAMVVAQASRFKVRDSDPTPAPSAPTLPTHLSAMSRSRVSHLGNSSVPLSLMSS